MWASFSISDPRICINSTASSDAIAAINRNIVPLGTRVRVRRQRGNERFARAIANSTLTTNQFHRSLRTNTRPRGGGFLLKAAIWRAPDRKFHMVAACLGPAKKGSKTGSNLKRLLRSFSQSQPTALCCHSQASASWSWTICGKLCNQSEGKTMLRATHWNGCPYKLGRFI